MAGITLSFANYSGLSAVTCLVDRCNYSVLLLAFLDHWNRVFSLIVIK